jgi:hypothetical protein
MTQKSFFEKKQSFNELKFAKLEKRGDIFFERILIMRCGEGEDIDILLNKYLKEDRKALKFITTYEEHNEYNSSKSFEEICQNFIVADFKEIDVFRFNDLQSIWLLKPCSALS